MLLILGGCSSHRVSGYLLWDTDGRTPSVGTISEALGVEKVQLPEYLKQNHIVYENKNGQLIEYTDAKWAVHLPESLTDRLIASLQQALRTPQIYLYPWQTHQKLPLLLKLTISRFIAGPSYLVLHAHWQLYDTRTKETKSFLYRTRLPMPEKFKATDIVETMNRAYRELEKEIALSILSYIREKKIEKSVILKRKSNFK